MLNAFLIYIHRLTLQVTETDTVQDKVGLHINCYLYIYIHTHRNTKTIFTQQPHKVGPNINNDFTNSLESPPKVLIIHLQLSYLKLKIEFNYVRCLYVETTTFEDGLRISR